MEPRPQRHIPGSKGRRLGEISNLLKNSPFPLPGLGLQLVCDGEDGLQDRHEAGHLAEAAAARHLGMYCKPLTKAACIHTSRNFMEPSQDVR